MTNADQRPPTRRRLTLAHTSLGADTTAVWAYKGGEPAVPLIGSVGLTLTRADKITIEGRGSGTTGTVKVGGVTATTTSWAANRISATVLASVAAGTAAVTVTTTGRTSNTYAVTTESGAQVPVMFTVNNAPRRLPHGGGPASSLFDPTMCRWSPRPRTTTGRCRQHDGPP